MQQKKECSNCGHINKADAARCTECGHKFFGTIPLHTEDISQNRPTSLFNPWQKISGVVLLIVLVGGGLLFLLRSNLHGPSLILTPTSTSSTQLQLPDGLGVVKAPNGENVGVNDGTYAPFDIGPQRPNSDLKLQAFQALRDGNSQEATSLWSESLSGPDTNDAEVKIYLENQNASAFPHVTLIVGLDFQQPFPDTTSQGILQGAYIAQKEFNDSSQHTSLKMLLLLANTGGDLNYISPVIQQLAQIIKKDPTIVGILGWETSSRTENVLAALRQYHVNIPILSEYATDDHLTSASPHFFRIAAPNKQQAPVLSKLAIDQLHATQAIVIEDVTNAYTQNVVQDFENQFKQAHPDGILAEKSFTAGKTTTAQFSEILKQALSGVHDTSHVVIFFAGAFISDANNFQNAIGGDYAKLRVISGDTGYVVSKNVYGRWYFTSSAFHDEWKALMGKDNPFFNNYKNEFDQPINRPSDYGYALPSDATIVSYDAAKVLSYGIDTILKESAMLTPQNLGDALSQITGPQAFQGVSGLIDFQPDHDPNNKAFVVLKVDETGHLQLLCVQGHFSPDSDSSPSKCDTYFHHSSTP